jgi:hypothetical protein
MNEANKGAGPTEESRQTVGAASGRGTGGVANYTLFNFFIQNCIELRVRSLNLGHC